MKIDKITITRDGIVKYWNVYLQQWVEEPADLISPQDLYSMPEKDRERIIKAAERIKRERND